MLWYMMLAPSVHIAHEQYIYKLKAALMYIQHIINYLHTGVWLNKAA